MLALALGAVVYVANEDRGIPYVFLLVGFFFLFWSFVLGRTRFGRYVYAVGGNAEAARRAGINVDRIKIAVFAICSFMAAVGGLVLASRLRSVDTNAGGGSILLYSIAAAVIGGTSLFGGIGHIKSAILGALVIASIDNGLGLLGLGSGEKFLITGGVLLLAVTVDSLSRRRQAQSGQSVTDRVAFITGASRGVGAAVARAFHAAGDRRGAGVAQRRRPRARGRARARVRRARPGAGRGRRRRGGRSASAGSTWSSRTPASAPTGPSSRSTPTTSRR